MLPNLKVLSSVYGKFGWTIEGELDNTYFKAKCSDFRDEIICKTIECDMPYHFEIGQALKWYGLVDKVELEDVKEGVVVAKLGGEIVRKALEELDK